MRDPRCPVCAWPAGDDARCRDCGWTLRTPWRLGAGDAKAFEAELGIARLGLDLRAAARLGDVWQGPDALLRGVPDDAAWAAARAGMRPAQGPARPVLEVALRRLPEGAELAVLEVTLEGVTATRVTGQAQILARTPVHRWTDLLPALSTDPAERALQLAGAQHTLDRPSLEPALATALAAWTRCLPPSRVAICRSPGLPLPDLATRLLATPAATAAESGELAVTLARIAEGLPIRTGYGLLVARLGPGRGVSTELTVLLAAGAQGGATGELTVYRAPGTGAPTTLAVCTVERLPRLVAAWRATLPAGQPVRVRVKLDAPDRVRLEAPAGPEPEPRDLDGILHAVPTRFEPPPPLLEVDCLLELNGPAERVRLRRELLAGLLDLLAAESAGRVRASVLGYADHFYRERTILEVLHGGGPHEPPATVRAVLDRLPAPADAYAWGAAPLEDALTALATRSPTGHAPRVLLTVAGRPPHPADTEPAGGQRSITGCPLRRTWTTALPRVAAARRVTVLDRVPDRPGLVWRELGANGLLPLDGTAPRTVAAALGLLPAVPVPFSIPLAHPI